MSAVALGIGLSGILVNIMRIITIFVGQQMNLDDPFYPTITFVGVVAVINFTSAMMYFVEKKNEYAIYINKRAENILKNSEHIGMFDIIRACREAKETLFYLIFVYIITFVVYPGVTNNAKMKIFDYDDPTGAPW